MTDADTITVHGLPIPHGAIPHKGGFLMPPWAKGTSGNPSGLTKDGKGTRAHAIEAQLLEHLGAPSAKRSTRTWSERIVLGWLKAAAKGDAAARRDILERLYPVPQDAAQGKQVLEGLKLELTPGGASLTMLRATPGASRAQDDGTPIVGQPVSVDLEQPVTADLVEQTGGPVGVPETP
jgi:hypothetical protein